MNDSLSATGRLDDDAPGSPKRKKVRAKYAPKACVSCRRSKLKCSGENPCQRCSDCGRRCFYSEDQTAAEALQNLSRPTVTQAPMPSNGHGGPRRSLMPRHDVVDRRASDAGIMGTTMEARMARIENMMEALVQDRGFGFPPRSSGSLERSIERDDFMGDSFQGDVAFQGPLEVLNVGTPFMRSQGLLPSDNSFLEPRLRQSISETGPQDAIDSASSSIRVGSKSFAFPTSADYQKYIGFFFEDLHPFHPCVNEAEFRSRSEKMLVSRVIHSSEISFLALNYIIFACSDIGVDTTPAGVASKPPGWQWFQTADELVGKRTLSGRGDLSMIQFLIYEAIYLMRADKPNASYNVIGLACRLCFQFGLHQQTLWRNCTPFTVHMRQRIFWTLYYTDRLISLSCRRPYGIRDSDIDVAEPLWISDPELLPDQPLPEPNLNHSANIYLSCMVSWAKLAGDVWDQVFAAAASENGIDGEKVANVDARITHWRAVSLPTIPLIPVDRHPDTRQKRQHILVNTRLDYLRILLYRSTMTSLTYDGNTGHLCGDLALSTISRLKGFDPDTKEGSSFRFHMAVSLGSAILILSTLLVRDLAGVGLEGMQGLYAERWREGVGLLRELGEGEGVARRIMDDLKEVVGVVAGLLDAGLAGRGTAGGLVPQDITGLFPYGEAEVVGSDQGAGVREGGLQMWNGGESVADWGAWDGEGREGGGVLWI